MKKNLIFNNPKRQIVTVIGELLIDEIAHEDTDEFEIVVGGSPLNVAINLRDLGLTDIRLFGSVGNDLYGSMILQKLEDKGIDISNIAISDKKTSIVKINKSTGTPDVLFDRGSDNLIEFTKALEQSVQESAIVHFSYWPLSDEPSRSTILKVIEVAEQNDTIIGFDPNYHIDLVSENSFGEALVKEVIAKANIAKPSIDDSNRLLGETLNNETLLSLYSSMGCDVTVLSLGKDGVIAKYNNEIVTVPSAATIVKDATGAGDAFYAGMYMGILQGLTFEETLYLGSACSAYNLQVIGGLSNLPSFETIQESLRK